MVLIISYTRRLVHSALSACWLQAITPWWAVCNYTWSLWWRQQYGNVNPGMWCGIYDYRFFWSLCAARPFFRWTSVRHFLHWLFSSACNAAEPLETVGAGFWDWMPFVSLGHFLALKETQSTDFKHWKSPAGLVLSLATTGLLMEGTLLPLCQFCDTPTVWVPRL